jgi:large subunit ribosomal protein L10
MPVPTAKKAATIDELTDKLARINAAALIEYRGLTVKEIGNLRSDLRKRNVELQVTKNTLLREAAHRNNMLNLDELFHGPTAVAFIYDDEAAGTKALNDYFRTARVGQIKAGLLRGGRSLTAEQFTKLADLPSRETLLAQIAGLFNGPLSQMASLLNAPMQQFAYALGALEEKGGPAGAGVQAAAAPAAAETPADTVAVTETPVAETPVVTAAVAETPAVTEVVSAAPAAEEAVGAEPAAPEPLNSVAVAPEAVASAEPVAPSAGESADAPTAAPEVVASAEPAAQSAEAPAATEPASDAQSAE